MNIITLLKALKEDIDIQKYNSLIKDKVSPEVIENLSKRRKNGKYDNITVEIFKAIQRAQWKNEADYLKKNAGKIHGILKVIGQGNSSFNPGSVLKEFGEFCYKKSTGEKDLDDFWKQKYSEARSGKYLQEKRDANGMKQTRSTELPDAFILFPRTLKTTGKFDLSVPDLDKQYADIKALAAELAKKDTSGETNDEGKKANAVHWCVASPGNEGYYYKHYKERGDGIFLIIVDKNKDGSPNYNRRYLYWINEDGSTEFADKFDDHVSMHNLDRSTLLWLDKFRDKFLENKKKKVSENKVEDEIWNRASSDVERYEQKEMKTPENLKKIFRLFADRNKQAAANGDLAKAVKDIQEMNDKLAEAPDMFKYLVNNGAEKHKNEWAKWYVIDKKPLNTELAKMSRTDGAFDGRVFLTFSYYGGSENQKLLFNPRIAAKDEEELRKILLKAKSQGVLKVYEKYCEKEDLDFSWGEYSRNVHRLKDAKYGWKKGQSIPETSKTYQDAASHFKNNKKLMQAYKELVSNRDYRVSQMLDNNFTIASVDKDGKRGYAILFYPHNRFGGHETVGYVDDKDIIQKIKEKFNELDNPKPVFHDGRNHKEGEPVRPKKMIIKKKNEFDDEDLPF